MEGFTIKNSNRFLETGSLRIGESQQGEISRKQNSGLSPSQETSFADTLKNAINEVNELQQTANKKAQELAVGKTDNVADVMIAAEKADIAMRVMVQVRNKVIDAYNEIMRMQV